MPQIGLMLPTAAPDARADTAVTFARAAEAAGLGSVWIIDRLVFDNVEPLVALAAVAASTTRVRLGTSVLLGTLRPPALLAKQVATLDVLSGGRVILGLGVGSRPDDFVAAGVPYAARGARLAEAMRVLRQVWSGAPLAHEGRAYQLAAGPIGPRPAQPGGPPLWVGGSAEAALRRAGRLADGYIGSSSGGPAGLRAAADTVRQAAAAAGRDPGALTIACLVWASVDDDQARADARAAAYMRHYYPPARQGVPAASLVGPPALCRERAQEYQAAGAEVLIVGPVSSDPAHLDRLLNEVLTRL
ncbi:MAG TPA: LLM class flavin-dependent oxidoreductase [Chloroflexota bacterium]|nr:LLM class flavin-dependent oxidoreductase [Chloroflexota bacterium]